MTKLPTVFMAPATDHQIALLPKGHLTTPLHLIALSSQLIRSWRHPNKKSKYSILLWEERLEVSVTTLNLGVCCNLWLIGKKSKARMRSPTLEALAVHNGWPTLIILLLGDPHLLEGGQRS